MPPRCGFHALRARPPCTVTSGPRARGGTYRTPRTRKHFHVIPVGAAPSYIRPPHRPPRQRKIYVYIIEYDSIFLICRATSILLTVCKYFAFFSCLLRLLVLIKYVYYYRVLKENIFVYKKNLERTKERLAINVDIMENASYTRKKYLVICI